MKTFTGQRDFLVTEMQPDRGRFFAMPYDKGEGNGLFDAIAPLVVYYFVGERQPVSFINGITRQINQLLVNILRIFLIKEGERNGVSFKNRLQKGLPVALIEKPSGMKGEVGCDGAFGPDIGNTVYNFLPFHAGLDSQSLIRGHRIIFVGGGKAGCGVKKFLQII